MYFDDLKVTHTHSPIVAGADFYPFGLAMDGREIKDEHYRWGYQGQYAEKDTITGLNEFQLRMYDARFGRWLNADPYGQYASPYLAMGNVPQMSVDPDGGWNWTAAGVGFAAGAGIGYAITGDWEGALLGGLAGGAIGGASFRSDTKSVSAGSQTGGFSVLEKTIVPTKFGYASGNLLASAGKGYLNFESQSERRPDPIDIFGPKEKVFEELLEHLYYMGHNKNKRHDLSDIVKSLEPDGNFLTKDWQPTVTTVTKNLKYVGNDVQFIITVPPSEKKGGWKNIPVNQNLSIGSGFPKSLDDWTTGRPARFIR